MLISTRASKSKFLVGSASSAAGVINANSGLKRGFDGVSDLRRAPLTESGGSIDWAEVVHALGSLPADTPWGMDLTEDPGREKPVVLAADSFSRLEELLAND